VRVDLPVEVEDVEQRNEERRVARPVDPAERDEGKRVQIDHQLRHLAEEKSELSPAFMN
jgi:hypothetical protein